MTAQEILNQYPTKVSLTTELTNVIDSLQNSDSPGVVVVNEQDIVVGLISQRDLFTKDQELHIPTYLEFLSNSRFGNNSEKELPHAANRIMHAKASDLMNQAVYFAKPETDISTIAKMLETTHQEIVPIVNEENKLIGIVSSDDVIKSLAGDELLPQLNSQTTERPFDNEIDFVRSDLAHRFAFVAHSRSHFWLTLTIILFAIGFILGIIFIVDPEPLIESLTHNIQTLLGMISGQ